MAFRPMIPGSPQYNMQAQGLNFAPVERAIDSGIRRNALLEQREIDQGRFDAQQQMQREQMAAQAAHRNAMLAQANERMKMAQANANRQFGLQERKFGLEQQEFANKMARRQQMLELLSGGGGTPQPAPTLTGDERPGPLASPSVPQAQPTGGILAGLSPQARQAMQLDYMSTGGKNFANIIQNDSTKKLTPAQKAIDSAFAKDYAAFVAQGGSQDVVKQLDQLDFAIKELEKGGVSGWAEGVAATYPAMGAQVNSRAVEVKNAIDEVTQRNLRAVLGGQFAAQEGEQLIQRAYQPFADEKDNLRRVRRLRTSIANAYKQKLRAARYYEANGTLVGYKGELPTLESIAKDAGLDDATYNKQNKSNNVTYTTPDGRNFVKKDGKWFEQ